MPCQHMAHGWSILRGRSGNERGIVCAWEPVHRGLGLLRHPIRSKRIIQVVGGILHQGVVGPRSMVYGLSPARHCGVRRCGRWMWVLDVEGGWRRKRNSRGIVYEAACQKRGYVSKVLFPAWVPFSVAARARIRWSLEGRTSKEGARCLAECSMALHRTQDGSACWSA